MKYKSCILLALAAILIPQRVVSEKLHVELSETPLSSMNGFDKVLNDYHKDIRSAIKSEIVSTVDTLKKRVDENPIFYVQQQRIERQQSQFAKEVDRMSKGTWHVDYMVDTETGKHVPAATNIVNNIVTVDIGTESNVKSAIRTLRGMKGVKKVRPVPTTEPKLYNVNSQINIPESVYQKGKDIEVGKGVSIAFIDDGVFANHTMMSGEGITPLEIPEREVPNDITNINNKVRISRPYGVRFSYPSEFGNHHGIAVSSIAAGRPVNITIDGQKHNISGVAPGSWVFNYFGNHDISLEQVLLDRPDIVNVAWGYDVSAWYNSHYPWYRDYVQISKMGAVLVKSAGDEGPGYLTSDHVGGAAGGIVVGAATKTKIGRNYLIIDGEKYEFTRTAPSAKVKRLEYKLQSLDDDQFLSCDLSDIHNFTDEDAVLVMPTEECTIQHLAKSIEDEIGLIIYAQNSDYDSDPGKYDIPFVVVSHVDGVKLLEKARKQPGASITIEAAYAVPEHPDAVASYSSRGPSVEMTLVPHLIAPGSGILAAGYGDVPDPRRGYSVQSGSSMATAVVSGAAAILRQNKKEWTNAEIKSALMSTAEYRDIRREEDGEYADVLDMGAGRINLEKALAPVLSFDPPMVDFSIVPRNQTKKAFVNVSSYFDEKTKVSVVFLIRDSKKKLVEVNKSVSVIEVQPQEFEVKKGDAPVQLQFIFRNFGDKYYGDHSLFVVFRNAAGEELAHLPLWGQGVCNDEEKKDVFLITLDARKCANESQLYPIEDLRKHYEAALDKAKLSYETYEYCDTNGPITIPAHVMNLCFRAVIVASGSDYGYPLNSIEDDFRRLMHSGVPVIQMGANSALNWGPIDEMYGSRWVLDHEFGFNTPASDGWKPDNYVQISKIDRYPLIETKVPRIGEGDYDYEVHIIYRDARNHPLVFLFRDQPEVNMVDAVWGSTGVTSFVGLEKIANQNENAPLFIKDLFLAATETSTSDISVVPTFNKDEMELKVAISTKSIDRKISYVEIFWNDKGEELTIYNESFFSKSFKHAYNTTRKINPYIVVTSAYQNHFVYYLGEYDIVIKNKSFIAKNWYWLVPVAFVVVVIIIFTIVTIIIKNIRRNAKNTAYKSLQEDLIFNKEEEETEDAR